MTANWIAQASDSGPNSSEGYRLEASSTAFSGIGVLYSSATADVTLSTLTVSGLDISVAYTLRVGAINHNGVANYVVLCTSTTLATPPPTAPTITSVHSSSISVSWGTQPTGNGYTVEASTWNGFGATVVSSTTPDASLASLFVEGLSPNTTYFLQVGALYPGVKPDNTHWRANWPVAHRSTLDETLERSITYLAWRRYCTDWWEEKQNRGAWVIVDFGHWYQTTGDDYAQPTDAELGFHNTRRNLISIIGTAKAHGAEVMLVSQATRMSDFDKATKSRAAQREAFERVVAMMGEVANERSVPFCDARPVLETEAARQVAELGKDSIFTNEVHMTDAGCDLLARTLAARIVELGLVK